MCTPSQFNRSTLQLTNASAPSENAFDGLAVTNTTNEVTKTDLFSASAQNQANTPDANSQETMATTDFVMKTVESLRGMPAFTITSLKLHPLEGTCWCLPAASGTWGFLWRRRNHPEQQRPTKDIVSVSSTL